jgi:hypothetical protein
VGRRFVKDDARRLRLNVKPFGSSYRGERLYEETLYQFRDGFPFVQCGSRTRWLRDFSQEQQRERSANQSSAAKTIEAVQHLEVDIYQKSLD